MRCFFFSCDGSWRGEVINSGDERGEDRGAEYFTPSNRWVGRQGARMKLGSTRQAGCRAAGRSCERCYLSQAAGNAYGQTEHCAAAVWSLTEVESARC